MSITCGFYNSEDGDRMYTNQDLSNLFEGLMQDGVFGFVGEKMLVKPTQTPSMAVLVSSGRAWFNETWTKIDSAYTVEIPAADPALNRIDAVCLTINKTRAVRNNYIEIISGTGASGNPTKPTVSDEPDIYRHVLAYVTVSKGATSITADKIESNIGKDGCPYSMPTWENTPSASDYTAQWQSQFDQFMDNVHETFNGDAVTSLQTGVSNFAFTESQLGREEIKAGDLVLINNELKQANTVPTDPNSPITYTRTRLSTLYKDIMAKLGTMQTNFQAGVDTIVNGCYSATGIMPEESTPSGIVASINNVMNTTWEDYAEITLGSPDQRVYDSYANAVRIPQQLDISISVLNAISFKLMDTPTNIDLSSSYIYVGQPNEGSGRSHRIYLEDLAVEEIHTLGKYDSMMKIHLEPSDMALNYMMLVLIINRQQKKLRDQYYHVVG